jgi:hypothetical protein
MWRGFCESSLVAHSHLDCPMRFPFLLIAGVSLAGCGGTSSQAPGDPELTDNAQPPPMLESADVLPDELEGLHGHMTAEGVEDHLETELDCGTDLCGGPVPYVVQASPESQFSHYEFYFDIDGARPLYQVIGMPRMGQQQEPMVGLLVGEGGLSFQTADGHTVRVHREGGRTVWTWERSR